LKEVKELTREELIEWVLKLEEEKGKLEKLVMVDALAEVYNRRCFDLRMEEEWRRASRGQWPLAVLMVDIDNFKLYNDCYGHLTGDDCLWQVAQTLKCTLSRPGDFLARFGGEEFMVILPNTNLSEAVFVANALRKGVQNLQIEHKKSTVAPIVTVSIGAAAGIPDPGKSNLDKLVAETDKNLYRAKNSGRNRVVHKKRQ